MLSFSYRRFTDDEQVKNLKAHNANLATGLEHEASECLEKYTWAVVANAGAIVANAGATDLVRGDGCFYKTAVASGGERVTWRVFMPWEERDGGRCLNAVPAELWAAPGAANT